jgi:hypothetical protein
VVEYGREFVLKELKSAQAPLSTSGSMRREIEGLLIFIYDLLLKEANREVVLSL